MKAYHLTYASLGTALICLGAGIAAKAANLPLNTVVNGEISRPGQQDVYTFTGTAGQRLYYDSREADNEQIYIRLASPTGNSPNINGNNSDSDIGPFTLAETGTYSFIVDGSGAATGDYSFRMVDLGTAPALTLSTVITRTLDPGYSVDWFRFTATGGEHLFFDGLGANVGASWYLFGPYNEFLAQAGIGADFEATLTSPGQYLVAVAGTSASPVPYSVEVVPFTITTKALAFDATTTGTIAGPGDQFAYTFTATAGQQFFYDALESDFDQIAVRLIHPNGSPYLLNGQNADSDYGPFTLVDAGTYTLIIDGVGSTTGDFSFRLENLSAAPVLQLDTVISKTLTPGYSVDWYRFNGTAGQLLFFDGLGANTGGNWYLFGPNNAGINSSGIGGDFELALPVDGQYLVALAGASASPVPYSVQVVTFDVTTSALTLGATVTGNIAEPGERHSYSFTGTAGQRIYYDALDLDSESINARLLSPSGTVIWEVNHSTDVGPTLLTANGTYTVVVDGNGATVGDFSFRVLNLASATAMTLTAPVNGSLNPRSETDLYQFNGTKGQRISFDSISVTGNDANWRLVGPANETLVQGNITTDLPSVTLPESGAMTLLIEGTTVNVAALNYQVRLADISDTPVAASGFNVIINGTLAGEPTTNTFKAPAGLLIYFDSQDGSSFGVNAEIRDPANNLFQNLGAYADAGPFVLPVSGTYSVIARGTGTYRFRILDLAANSVALTLGAEVQQPLDPAFRTEVYRFTGASGQRLVYDALENDNDQVFVRLLTPDFTWQINNPNSDSDQTPITLGLAGTYYLFQESRVNAPTDYHFRLLNATAAPAATLDTPITDTLTPGLGATVYRIAGSPGQLLFFDGAVGNSGAAWTLYGANNEYVAGGGGLGSDFEYTLAQSTGYLLVLWSSSITPVGYTIEVVDSNGGGAAAGAPLITDWSVAGSAVTVTWTSVAGKTYFLQFKSALTDPAWTDVSGGVNATGSSSSKTDNAGSAAQRFYQVRVAP